MPSKWPEEHDVWSFIQDMYLEDHGVLMPIDEIKGMYLDWKTYGREEL